MPTTQTSKALLLVLVTIILCVLQGCQFDSPPVVEVKGARWFALSQSEPRHVQLEIDLELENVQDEPVQLEKFEYTFRSTTSDGQKDSWSGIWLPLRTIPPNMKINLTVPAVVEVSESEIEWEIRGDLSYKAPGRWAQILFDTGLRTPSTGFKGTGRSTNPEDS